MKSFKYLEVQKYILDYIKENSANDFVKIPSERVISNLLGVSRTTVKYAIGKLVENKVLVQLQGSGTYINPDSNQQKISINKNTPNALTMNSQSKGLEVNSQVISFKVIYNSSEFSSIFHKTKIDLYQLVRIRNINDTPHSIETSYFPFRVFPDANRYNFSTESLYAYMEHKGYKPTFFDKKIEVKRRPDINKMLRLDRESLLFYEEYVAYSQDKLIIEYSQTFSNPNNVEFGF